MIRALVVAHADQAGTTRTNRNCRPRVLRRVRQTQRYSNLPWKSSSLYLCRMRGQARRQRDRFVRSPGITTMSRLVHGDVADVCRGPGDASPDARLRRCHRLRHGHLDAGEQTDLQQLGGAHGTQFQQALVDAPPCRPRGDASARPMDRQSRRPAQRPQYRRPRRVAGEPVGAGDDRGDRQVAGFLHRVTWRVAPRPARRDARSRGGRSHNVRACSARHQRRAGLACQHLAAITGDGRETCESSMAWGG
jgi:hypothetical protein